MQIVSIGDYGANIDFFIFHLGERNACIVWKYKFCLFVCVEVLRPSQPNGVMSSAVSLPNHTFTGQA